MGAPPQASQIPGWPGPRLEVARHAEVVLRLERMQRLVVDLPGFVVGVDNGRDRSWPESEYRRCPSSPRSFLPAPRPARGCSRSSDLPMTMGTSSKLPSTVCSHGNWTSMACSPPAEVGVMALLGEADGGAHLRQLAREFLVDWNGSQRRFVGVAIVDRGEVEAHVMRRGDDDDAGILVALERRIGPRSDGAGVGIAGVRRDCGENRTVRAAAQPAPACRRSWLRVPLDRQDRSEPATAACRTLCDRRAQHA